MNNYIPSSASDFPASLRVFPNVAGVWVRGQRATLANNADHSLGRWMPTVSIVGARACSDYGAHVARTLARDLVREGVTVVSGLARGVDGHAHRGALEGDGKTIAVLPCGIDRDYPNAHAELAESIVESGGAVISEYEPGIQPAPWRFFARNRLIAALGDVTVVVEAREESGSMHTASVALGLSGRKVMAVPGQITSTLSSGPNLLLAHEDVRPCLGAGDVLNALAACVSTG